MISDSYFKKTLFKLEYLYVLIMASANPGGGAEYREVIKNYVGEKLRRSGIIVNGYETEEVNEPILEIAATLRRVGDELERSSAEFFGNMCNQLHITRNNAHQIFQGVCDEIFLTGTNWGRIVAFLTFGSTFAIASSGLYKLRLSSPINSCPVNLGPVVQNVGAIILSSWISALIRRCMGIPHKFLIAVTPLAR